MLWRCQAGWSNSYFLSICSNDLMFSPTKENLVTKLAICGKVFRRARVCIWPSSTIFETQVASGICKKWRMSFFIFTEVRRTAQIYTVAGFTFLEAAREGSEWWLVFQKLGQYSKTERKMTSLFQDSGMTMEQHMKRQKMGHTESRILVLSFAMRACSLHLCFCPPSGWVSEWVLIITEPTERSKLRWTNTEERLCGHPFQDLTPGKIPSALDFLL